MMRSMNAIIIPGPKKWSFASTLADHVTRSHWTISRGASRMHTRPWATVKGGPPTCPKYPNTPTTAQRTPTDFVPPPPPAPPTPKVKGSLKTKTLTKKAKAAAERTKWVPKSTSSQPSTATISDLKTLYEHGTLRFEAP
mmetsp:Transcript_34827/g.56385  ORF Transcript_34827/g.56385 Transcript_34827/m.56385 type:complete len:139 (-) Transcript_34827:6-422(-)